MSIIQISAKELQKKIQNESNITLLDVREPDEFKYAHIEGSLHIPLNQVFQRIQEINTEIDCIVICHHGVRSQQAAYFLIQSGFSKVYNLVGGIDAWSIECDNTLLRY